MYFPSLALLAEEGFDSLDVNKFDYWLASLTGLKKKRIRPARFSVDMNIPYDISNELFSVAAVKLKLLSINYEVYCPNELCINELVEIYTDFDSIPDKLGCPKCKQIFSPVEHDEQIIVTFNLMHEPNPKKPNERASKSTGETYKGIKPRGRSQKPLNVATFMHSNYGKDEIENMIFKPDWVAYKAAYDRFILSQASGVSTEEKGNALESLSCLLMSFITFFNVDSSVHTQTNQIDVTITIRPYFKYINIPILQVLNRRVLCECKNEDKNIPSQWVDKLSAVMDKVDFCRVGIIFSRDEFSGDDWKFAKASQIEHARLKKYILSITTEDFTEILNTRPNVLYFLDKKLEELEMRITKRA